MWRWRRVAVARVFALVVRCRIMLFLLYSRVGKNRDTSRGPRREPGQAAPLTTLQSSLARKFSRCGAPMTYTDLLGTVLFQNNITDHLNVFLTRRRMTVTILIVVHCTFSFFIKEISQDFDTFHIIINNASYNKLR
jgi:hypothetical protein